MITETRVLTGGLGTFVSGWEYNSAGLLAAMTYPADDQGNAGERVSYSYHPQMALDGMLGEFPDVYVNGTQYDAAGRVVERALGNENEAVLQQYIYNDWSTQGGRLLQLKSGTLADPESLQYLQYTYDEVGNVLSIQDYRMGSPQTQTFSYDDLYRLTGAQASGGSQGVYGPESYT